jgi:glycerol kinase
MHKKYIISVDQSTQGTKAVLFDETGKIIIRCDEPHEQIINEQGWVSHNLNEIYQNTLKSIRGAVETSGIDKGDIIALAITNQRETSAIWQRQTR